MNHPAYAGSPKGLPGRFLSLNHWIKKGELQNHRKTTMKEPQNDNL